MNKKTIFVIITVWVLAVFILMTAVILLKVQENSEKINIIRDDLKYLDSESREILNKLHEQEGNMG